MFVVVRAGEGLYGKVRCAGGSYVATRFFHIWHVPVFPIATRSVLVLREDQPGEPGLSVPVPLDARSVLSAYGRFWCVAWAVLGTVHLAKGGGPVLTEAAKLLALGAGATLSYASKRPLPSERLYGLVYAEVTGFAVDIAHAGDHGLVLRHQLSAYLDDRARDLDAGYREAAGGEGSWVEAARRGEGLDRDFLVAAISALRLDEALAQSRPDVPSPVRGIADHRGLRASLMKRLLALDPGLRQRADAPMIEPPAPSPAIAWARQNAAPFDAPPAPPGPAFTLPLRAVGALMVAVGLGVCSWLLNEVQETGSLYLPAALPALTAPPAGLYLLAFGDMRVNRSRVALAVSVGFVWLLLAAGMVSMALSAR